MTLIIKALICMADCGVELAELQIYSVQVQVEVPIELWVEMKLLSINTHGWWGKCQNLLFQFCLSIFFQISILRECESEFCHVCGGTIISPAWILTSAHCVSSVPLEEMGILMGDHNLYELSYEQKFVRAIEKVTHPGFVSQKKHTLFENSKIVS